MSVSIEDDEWDSETEQIAQKQASGERAVRDESLGEKEWEETDHPRVYIAEQSPFGEIGDVPAQIAEAFPNWDVVVTVGPYRGYDIAYNIRWDLEVIHIDLYSIRLPSKDDVARTARDIHKHLENVRSNVTDEGGN
jgi:hypothetical protein